MLNDVLKSRIFGQDDAIDTIVTTLINRDNTKPIVFHFAGDNGTGKTITAKTIAEAMFAVKNMLTDSYRGLLYLRGNHYCTEGEHDGHIEFREQIMTSIVTQLSKCKESLIIFDEAELPSRKTMQIFEEIFDDQSTLEYKDIKVSKAYATFILISDFGTDNDDQKLSPDEKIHKDTTDTWTYSKQVNTIDNIIPFNALEIVDDVPTSVREQVRFLLQNLVRHPPTIIKNKFNVKIQSIGIDDQNLDALALYVYSTLKDSMIYNNRNYRGIEQVFNKKVTPKLTSQIKYSNKKVDLRLKIEEDMIYFEIKD